VAVNADTKGAFDVTVAPLVNAWGFGFKGKKTGAEADSTSSLPTAQQVDSLLKIVGMDMLTYDAEHNLIHKKDRRTMLDFSAIAKGYGCDVVARLLKSKGINNYMVEIGGEVVVSGHNDKDQLWHIGINKPVDDSTYMENELQTVLSITDHAMATSGNYRNFYYQNGKKYAHTIDPHTGRPVSHSLLSATVIAPSCAVADAYATAFMVMGEERARQLLEKHRELRALFICAGDDGAHRIWQNISRK
jgi:thiamine biosynthesis lipoprotein